MSCLIQGTSFQNILTWHSLPTTVEILSEECKYTTHLLSGHIIYSSNILCHVILDATCNPSKCFAWILYHKTRIVGHCRKYFHEPFLNQNIQILVKNLLKIVLLGFIYDRLSVNWSSGVICRPAQWPNSLRHICFSGLSKISFLNSTLYTSCFNETWLCNCIVSKSRHITNIVHCKKTRNCEIFTIDIIPAVVLATQGPRASVDIFTVDILIPFITHYIMF